MSEKIVMTGLLVGGLLGVSGIVADQPIVFLIGVAGIVVAMAAVLADVWTAS
jgi:hypothetical protein